MTCIRIRSVFGFALTIVFSVSQVFADLRTAMTMASIRVAGYDLFAEQDDIEVERENGYGMVLNERALNKIAVPQQQTGYQNRLQDWLAKRNLQLSKTSEWGGLMSTPVNVLSPI